MKDTMMSERFYFFLLSIFLFYCLSFGQDTDDPPPLALDYYWVGGDGNWSDNENHWVTTSGGMIHHPKAPSSFDNVYFDNNSSVDGSNVIVTMDLPGVCHDFVALNTDFIVSIPFQGSSDTFLSISGSYSATSSLQNDLLRVLMTSSDAEVVDVTQGGKLGRYLYFDGTGSWEVGNFGVSSGIRLISGSVKMTQSDTLTFVDFDAPGVKLFDFTGLQLKTKFFRVEDADDLTLLPGDLFIDASGSSTAGDFHGGHKTYGEVTVSGSIEEFTGDNTFGALRVEPGGEIFFEEGSVQTVEGDFILNGTSENPIRLGSMTEGVQAIISKSSGSVNGNYLTISDINATGGANFTAINSVDGGNNIGWEFLSGQTISFDDISGKAYGSRPFELVATSTSGLNVSYESLNPEVIEIEGSTATVRGAGTVIIIASQSGNENYGPAEPIEQEVFVEKASLLVIAEDQSRTYLSDNPEFTIRYEGFIADDTSDDLAEIPVAFTTANETSDVGTYEIELTGGFDTNYSFEYITGFLEIIEATATITLSNERLLVNGNPQSPTVTTDPEGLDFAIIWEDGSAPVTVGDYNYMVEIREKNYKGSITSILSLYEQALLSSRDLELKLFPNPTSDYVKVESAARLQMELIALDGRVLEEGTTDQVLDLRRLPPGLYLLKISRNGMLLKEMKILKK